MERMEASFDKSYDAVKVRFDVMFKKGFGFARVANYPDFWRGGQHGRK